MRIYLWEQKKFTQRWCITINNTLNKGSFEKLCQELVLRIVQARYFVMSLSIGTIIWWIEVIFNKMCVCVGYLIKTWWSHCSIGFNPCSPRYVPVESRTGLKEPNWFVVDLRVERFTTCRKLCCASHSCKWIWRKFSKYRYVSRCKVKVKTQ